MAGGIFVKTVPSRPGLTEPSDIFEPPPPPSPTSKKYSAVTTEEDAAATTTARDAAFSAVLASPESKHPTQTDSSLDTVSVSAPALAPVATPAPAPVPAPVPKPAAPATFVATKKSRSLLDDLTGGDASASDAKNKGMWG